MGVEARIECGWIPSLQHGNGVFDGINVALDSQKHLKAFFAWGKSDTTCNGLRRFRRETAVFV